MIWRAPQRGTRELKGRPQFDWYASKPTLALVHSFFANYLWPISAANDRDHIRW